jgi:hypothetical protein
MRITDSELEILYENFKDDWMDNGRQIVEQLRNS